MARPTQEQSVRGYSTIFYSRCKEKKPNILLYVCVSSGVNLLVGTENGLKLLDRSGQGKVYPLINSRRFQQMDVLEGLNLLITISGLYLLMPVPLQLAQSVLFWTKRNVLLSLMSSALLFKLEIYYTVHLPQCTPVRYWYKEIPISYRCTLDSVESSFFFLGLYVRFQPQ